MERNETRYPEAFSRTQMLLGAEAMERLRQAHVLVFGVGGVGSFVVESLARCGVGALTLVDGDVVVSSNLNRQIHATVETVGRKKVDVMRERILSVNPDCRVTPIQHFYLPDDDGGIITGAFDYVVDAIDTVSAKLDIVQKAQALSVPVISCMGTGNKLHPELLRLADIYETSVCPLCRVMRSELRKRGVKRLRVVYSQEIPLTPKEPPAEQTTRRATPGSACFVPPAAGLLIASEVVQTLTGTH